MSEAARVTWNQLVEIKKTLGAPNEDCRHDRPLRYVTVPHHDAGQPVRLSFRLLYSRAAGWGWRCESPVEVVL